MQVLQNFFVDYGKTYFGPSLDSVYKIINQPMQVLQNVE